MPETTLSLRGVTKTYGSGENVVHAVQGVTFETVEGEFLALVGPSGSGKTTLLAMIGALLTPTSGEIIAGDRSLADLSGAERAKFRGTGLASSFSPTTCCRT